MAIAGAATTAYSCKIVAGRLVLGQSQMVGRSLCKQPAEAVEALINAERVMVAGSDMVTVRDLLKAKGVQ
jgi:hypothetical protein